MAVSIDQSKTGRALNVLPVYTWATLPSATAVPLGYRVRASDVGIAPGMVLVSDGTRWKPDGPQVLARSAVAVSGAADTNENALATITVPAGLLGLNGGLDLRYTTTHTNSANTKTWRVRWGGAAGDIAQSAAPTTSANGSYQWRIQNSNSASAQTSQAFVGEVIANYAGYTKDTSAAVDILLTAQKASAGETMTLRQYVLLIHP